MVMPPQAISKAEGFSVFAGAAAGVVAAGGAIHIAKVPGVFSGAYQMHRRRAHIDKGNGDPVVLNPGKK